MAARLHYDGRRRAVQNFHPLFEPTVSPSTDLLGAGKRGEPVSIDRLQGGAA
jgi:hypothetical protein